MIGSRLFARPVTATGGLTGEIAWRYAAATAVTLIALAGAQLVVPTAFVAWLAVVTVAGVPVSLVLRLRDMRVGRLVIWRPLWNALTVISALSASALLLRVPLHNILGALFSGNTDAMLLQIGTSELMILLVQLFLVFAAFRSFSLISDKDATLATVPSFSVLLLLIPIHPSVEVVCYFLLWTLVAATLFALEHRAETRALVVAAVPAVSPGQDVKLAARSLASVLGISLVTAIALSGFLTARDPKESSSTESALATLASRLTQWTLQSVGGNSSAGVERQIDFSTEPTLPTRAVLWKASVFSDDNQIIQPLYWRLFTLSKYDGAVWSESKARERIVVRAPLPDRLWPLRRTDGTPAGTEERSYINGDFSSNLPRVPGRSEVPRGRRVPREPGVSLVPTGFDLAKAQPALANEFGSPRETVTFMVQSQRINLGYLPVLAPPLSLVLRDSDQDRVRLRSDGSVDVSVSAKSDRTVGMARVPRTAENGFPGIDVPLQRVAPSPRAPHLSAAERTLNLALPATLPIRVRQLSTQTTRKLNAQASNYARARALARATQNGAIYTLRPPPIPAGHDAADFFLFESRRGYCTYFAGALTVLCRAQGIPARVVSGFAPEPNKFGDIELREANAHAWTEIWIENWGWATVDATPPGDRGDNVPTFLENWSDLSAAKFDALLRWGNGHWRKVTAGGALLLLLFVAWRWRDRVLRRLGWDRVEDVEATRREIMTYYARAARELSRRFRPRAAWETPDEWLLAARDAVPNAPFEALSTLTSLYVRARFAPHSPPDEAVQRARAAQRTLKWPRKKTGA